VGRNPEQEAPAKAGARFNLKTAIEVSELAIEVSTSVALRPAGYSTTKWAMILRSPAENENGGISFHMVPSSTRHSRARGNPGLLRRISLDTRFRGYEGTQAGLLVLIPKRVFSKEGTKEEKIFLKPDGFANSVLRSSCPS